MTTDIASMTAEQQLVLKFRSIIAMLVFGAIAGIVLRRVFRAIEGDEFMETATSTRSPFDTP